MGTVDWRTACVPDPNHIKELVFRYVLLLLEIAALLVFAIFGLIHLWTFLLQLLKAAHGA
jgi:hypothetical protein